MLVNFKNETYVIKFKHGSYITREPINYKKTEAFLEVEHKYTLVMFRNIKDSYEDYIMMRVDCRDNDKYTKYIGRGLAFAKLLKFVIKDNAFKKVCLNAYNKQFSAHPLDIGSVMSY